MKRIQNHSEPIRRAGFTLVELLVVIVIMAILMALILPAIGRVRTSVQVAQVSAEITQIDQAIASFKAQFGVEPPSSLHIPAVGGTWDAKSRSIVRSIWPQFDFATNGGLGNGTTPAHLNGAECLVFFLGGVTAAPGSKALVGFSKNPRTPWTNAGDNKDGPFFKDFDAGRMVDIDGDGALEYLDPLPDQTTPYLYLSSQGKLYNKTNGPATMLTEQDDFDIRGGLPNPNPADLQNCYLTEDGRTPHRNQGYQIISPGLDASYGPGGVYKDGNECVGARQPEADNITNFANGVLRP